MLLALILAQAMEPASPEGPIYSSGTRYPFFALAPTTGAGMTAPCSCASSINGAKGETITFARAAQSYCTKYHPTDNILPGDMVLCANNQIKVAQPQNTFLTVMTDWTTTNNVTRSEEINNASWLTISTAGAVTVSPNDGTAPNNAATAEREETTACSTVGQGSYKYTQFTGTAVAWVASAYIRGKSGSGTTSICLYDGTSAGTCASCAYDATYFKRCFVSRTLTASASAAVIIGCNNATATYTGASNTGAGDFHVWGAQVELGTHPTAYVPTSGASASRGSGDNLATTLATAAGAQGSFAATYIPRHAASFPSGITNGGPIGWLGGNGRLMYNNSSANFWSYDGTNNPSLGAGYVYMTPKRYCSRWSTAGGWVLKNVTDGTSTSSAFNSGTFNSASTTLTFNAVGGFNTAGYLYDICFSRDTLECCP